MGDSNVSVLEGRSLMFIGDKINKKKIRVGLVGCGRISKKHFQAIKKYDELILVAVCDNNKIALKKSIKAEGVDGYGDYSLFLDHGMDIVILCTPSGVHAEQAILAASRKMHVITEKPMATLWSDALRMINAHMMAGTQLFVVKQNRFNSTLKLLKRALIENRFGKIYSVHINVFWTRPQEYYEQARWRGTWKMDGGALMNQASHYVDLLTWLIGPVADVHAMTGVLARDIEVEDTAVLNIRWKSGALGSMNVTMLTYPKNLEGSISIIGEKGTVKIGGVATNKIEHWEFLDKCDYDQHAINHCYEIDSVYGSGHEDYYRDIIKVMHRETDVKINGAEGLKSLEILTAAYLSSKTGNIVSLPLDR